jgi:hypothetical protein
VESSCERGNEPSGSIKCWELPSGSITCGLSSGTHLHRVSSLVIVLYNLFYINSSGRTNMNRSYIWESAYPLTLPQPQTNTLRGP